MCLDIERHKAISIVIIIVILLCIRTLCLEIACITLLKHFINQRGNDRDRFESVISRLHRGGSERLSDLFT